MGFGLETIAKFELTFTLAKRITALVGQIASRTFFGAFSAFAHIASGSVFTISVRAYFLAVFQFPTNSAQLFTSLRCLIRFAVANMFAVRIDIVTTIDWAIFFKIIE